MLFVLLAVLIIAVAGTDDVQNEIASSEIEEGSTQKAIASREFVDKTTATPRSGIAAKARRSRYLRQAPRPRRRPPFDLQVRNIRRPGNNYPNLYGPRSRFKPAGPYRPMPPKSHYRYYRENWRNKWPEQNQPYYPEEDEMEPEPYDEYDDMDEMKNEDPWYSKKYRDGYDDVMPVSSKYNEKRSPARFVPNYSSDYARQKMRANYDMFEGFRTEPVDWPERSRFTKNYRDYADIRAPGKKFVDDDPFPNHRFKFPNLNRFKLEDDEFDFSGNSNLKSRRYKADPAVIQGRRPAFDEARYEQDLDMAKYLTGLRTSFASKEVPQEPVYSAKYRGRDADKENEKKNEDHHSTGSTDSNVVPDWKRNQKQPEYQEQYLPTTKVVAGYDKGGDAAATRSQSYRDDQLLPSELIAYMSADPSESVVGKEERYLHATYPFLEKLSDHDVVKATFPRKISPVIDQDLEITFDERMGDWKHN